MNQLPFALIKNCLHQHHGQSVNSQTDFYGGLHRSTGFMLAQRTGVPWLHHPHFTNPASDPNHPNCRALEHTRRPCLPRRTERRIRWQPKTSTLWDSVRSSWAVAALRWFTGFTPIAGIWNEAYCLVTSLTLPPIYEYFAKTNGTSYLAMILSWGLHMPRREGEREGEGEAVKNLYHLTIDRSSAPTEVARVRGKVPQGSFHNLLYHYRGRTLPKNNDRLCIRPV